MSMFNVSEGFHSFMRAIGMEKPAAPQAPAAPPPAAPAEKPAEAHTLKKTESLEQAAKAIGKAQTVAIDTGSEIQAWGDARKSGKPVDFSQAPKDSKLSHVIFLKDENGYAKKYSPEQQKNISKFMQDVQAQSNKLNDSTQKGKILYIMDGGIADKGITDKQMDMIADGHFSAASYIAMVNKGNPIG